MILSILIASSKETKAKLDQLYAVLLPQLHKLDDIEIYIETDAKMRIGAKMNSLLKDSIGDYVWMLKDSDLVSETAVKDIYAAVLSEPDVVGISGMSTFNGRTPCDWKQGIDEERKPNHNSPMKRTIANIIPFRKRKVDSLEIWAKEMNRIAPWVTEIVIDKPIIHNRHELSVHAKTAN